MNGIGSKWGKSLVGHGEMEQESDQGRLDLSVFMGLLMGTIL